MSTVYVDLDRTFRGAAGLFNANQMAERPVRQGRNPKTGEPVPIPASKAPKFKPAKPLKDAVKG